MRFIGEDFSEAWISEPGYVRPFNDTLANNFVAWGHLDVMRVKFLAAYNEALGEISSKGLGHHLPLHLHHSGIRAVDKVDTESLTVIDDQMVALSTPPLAAAAAIKSAGRNSRRSCAAVGGACPATSESSHHNLFTVDSASEITPMDINAMLTDLDAKQLASLIPEALVWAKYGFGHHILASNLIGTILFFDIDLSHRSLDIFSHLS